MTTTTMITTISKRAFIQNFSIVRNGWHGYQCYCSLMTTQENDKHIQ